jgi:hypothetical protein
MLTVTFYHRNFNLFYSVRSKFNISSIYTGLQRYITAEGRLDLLKPTGYVIHQLVIT